MPVRHQRSSVVKTLASMRSRVGEIVGPSQEEDREPVRRAVGASSRACRRYHQPPIGLDDVKRTVTRVRRIAVAGGVAAVLVAVAVPVGISLVHRGGDDNTPDPRPAPAPAQRQPHSAAGRSSQGAADHRRPRRPGCRDPRAQRRLDRVARQRGGGGRRHLLCPGALRHRLARGRQRRRQRPRTPDCSPRWTPMARSPTSSPVG